MPPPPRAPGRPPSAASPSRSRAATAYSSLSVVPNIGGSSELMVTGTPAATSTGSGCSSIDGTARVRTLDVGHTSSAIRRLRQVRHQRRILRRRDAVPDPLRAQLPQRVPDRLRAGGLAGVRHRAQPGRAGLVEVGLELRAGYADLGTAEPEADQPVRPLLERDPQRLLGRGQAGLAGDVEAPAQLDAAARRAARAPGVLDRLAERRRRDAPRDTCEYGVTVSSA